MKIYKAEKELGLAKKIESNQSFSYCSPILTDGEKMPKVLATAGFTDFLNKSVHPDVALFPIFSILVSSVWNKNDDVFLPDEMWKARFTPEDKPLNIEHKPSRIIGHVTSSIPITDDYKIIDDEMLLEDLPEKYHLLTSAVIYKHPYSSDVELQTQAIQLIDNVSQGEYKVSMECIFNDFDYILDDGVEKSIVTRSEETAFLTKHLRCYGGSGVYNGRKIGRVLRHITFSGKGLVKNPGNEDSVIFNVDDNILDLISVDEKMSSDEGDDVNSNSNNNNQTEEDVTMATDNAYVDKLEKQIEKLNASIKEKDEKIGSLGEAKISAQLEAKDGEIAELKKAVEDAQAALENVKSEKTDAENAKAELEKKAEEQKAAFEEAQKELDEIKSEAKRISRVSTLVDAGLEKAEADKVVEKFASATDEMFDNIVEMQKNLVESKKMKEKEEDKKEDKKEDYKGKSDDESGDKDGEKSAASADLDDADNDDSSTGSEDDDNESNETAAALASVLSGLMGQSDENEK